MKRKIICFFVWSLFLGLARGDTVYTSSSGNNLVIKYNSTNGAGFVFTNLPGAPQGIAYDASGTIYVASFNGNSITRYTASGQGMVFASSGLNHPIGLAFDKDGNLFVGNWGNNSILKFTPDGTRSVFATTNLNGPYGLAFDTNGYLYVANISGNSISKFEANGQGSIFASTNMNAPIGLAFDTSGNLYVANAGNNTIVKFDQNGSGSLFANNNLNGPEGISFDSEGNLFVANYNGNSISKFDPQGNGSLFANLGLSLPTFLCALPDLSVPPVIYQNPTNQFFSLGSTTQFFVFAGGPPVLIYQWQFNGTNLPSMTNSVLTINNTQSNHIGAYTVTVSNAFGGVISAPAYLLPGTLEIHLMPALTIEGRVGRNVQVDFSTNLLQWYPLTNFVLPTSPYTFIDFQSSGNPNRFYRATF